MKLFTKRIISIFTIISFAFSLCGCGNNSSTSTEVTETIAGKYLPYSADFGDITMSYDDMVEADMADNIYVTIDKNQKTGEANFGEGASSFTLEDGNMVFEEDDETVKMGYEIQDDGSLKICLSDVVEEDYGADIHIYLAKEGDAFEAAKKASQEAGGTFSNILDGDDDELLDWWNGEWYGWWLITSASGEIANMEGEWYDTCAIIDISDDYTGTILIWDEDGSMDDPIGEVEVTLSADGLGSHGTLYSESGYFMDHELEHADWIIDPAVDYNASWIIDEDSSSTDGIENYIRMDGSAESDSDDYSYVIHLRKWGTYWNDIIEDERPYYYESWYVPLIEDGKTMPYKINNESTATTTAEPKESSENSSGEAGIVTLAHLKEVYAEYSKIVNNNYVFSTKSYEDVVSDMGVEGRPQDESVSSFWAWSDTKRYYEWLTEDENSWIIASFSKNSNGVFMCYSFSPTNDIIE